jgi:flagellar biosynthesis protein FliR
MHDSAIVPEHILAGFLLVIARVGAATSFIPIPGFRTSPAMVKTVFAVVTSLALFRFWPPKLEHASDPVWFFSSMLAEAVLGIGIGLFTGLLSEALVLGMQIISFQAGYSYASVIDPNTQAEAGYLPVLAQLVAGFLLFAFGVHHQMMRALAFSLTTLPPGMFDVRHLPLDFLLHAPSAVFTTGMRLAFPGVALLAMTDIVLALMSRLNSQLQVLTVAFPVKMLLALSAIAWTIALYPIVFREAAQHATQSVFRLIGG